jgi:rhodanese-related sulfurtransferase
MAFFTFKTLKNFTYLLLLGLVLTVVVANNAEAKKKKRKGKGRKTAQVGTFKSVSVEEFKKLMVKPNTVILDFRTEKEWLDGHIENAFRIDYLEKDFHEKVAKLPKNKTYLVYCQSGYRSSEGMKFMRSTGFKKVYELKEGYDSWSE